MECQGWILLRVYCCIILRSMYHIIHAKHFFLFFVFSLFLLMSWMEESWIQSLSRVCVYCCCCVLRIYIYILHISIFRRCGFFVTVNRKLSPRHIVGCAHMIHTFRRMIHNTYVYSFLLTLPWWGSSRGFPLGQAPRSPRRQRRSPSADLKRERKKKKQDEGKEKRHPAAKKKRRHGSISQKEKKTQIPRIYILYTSAYIL